MRPVSVAMHPPTRGFGAAGDEGMTEMLRFLGGTVRLLPVIGVVATGISFGATTAVAAEHHDSTPQEVFDSMRGSFQPAKAKGVHARYQWYLSGPHGGQWWIDVEDGKYKMGKGKIPNPNVTFVATDKDWVAVSNNELGGTWAYLTGRMKIRGDQWIARKLGEMFP